MQVSVFLLTCSPAVAGSGACDDEAAAPCSGTITIGPASLRDALALENMIMINNDDEDDPGDCIYNSISNSKE